jgi:hypothetical protein
MAGRTLVHLQAGFEQFITTTHHRPARAVGNRQNRGFFEDADGVFIGQDLTFHFDHFVDRNNPEYRGTIGRHPSGVIFRIFFFHILPPFPNQFPRGLGPERGGVMELDDAPAHMITLGALKEHTFPE